MTIDVLQLLASFFGPIIAASVVMFGWRRTHKDATNRDLDNWRRNALLGLTTRLLDLSTTRDKIILHTWNSYVSDGSSHYADWAGTKSAVVAMPGIAEQVRLLQAPQLASAMEELIRLHDDSDSTLADAHLIEPDLQDDLQNIMIDDDSLRTAHHRVAIAFESEIDIKARIKSDTTRKELS
ncbi:hypothetical protein [Rhodococcus sp. 077-4]|uniref:hypothetical protein n=1 Tax=Rhodococcus sp. 077-4 TaxID=2789271 RepID=UPI0039F51C8D